MKKAVKAILNVLSYGGIEVESARRLADIKKLDPIRIFLRKLDMEIYNGDYKVPIRLFFPDEKMEEHGADVYKRQQVLHQPVHMQLLQKPVHYR